MVPGGILQDAAGHCGGVQAHGQVNDLFPGGVVSFGGGGKGGPDTGGDNGERPGHQGLFRLYQRHPGGHFCALQLDGLRVRPVFALQSVKSGVIVSAATVCREIKRGTYTYMNADYIEVTEYIPERSHQRYRANMEAKGPGLKIGNHRDYAEKLEELIMDQDFSPSAALHEIENHPEIYGDFGIRVCRQTLYSYVDKRIFARLTNKDLPFKGSRRKTKTKHIHRMKSASKGDSIEKRPEEVNTRQEPGHWEMDLVVSCRGGHKCLLVLTERVTRQEIMRLIPDKTAGSVVRALNTIERKYGKLFQAVFKSITVDNGSEFADCAGLEQSVLKKRAKRTKMYYCHPYCSSERGSNEKQNQMIRRKFPKGTNFDKVSPKEVKMVEDWLNRYPRKILGWYSSADMFRALIEAV